METSTCLHMEKKNKELGRLYEKRNITTVARTQQIIWLGYAQRLE